MYLSIYLTLEGTLGLRNVASFLDIEPILNFGDKEHNIKKIWIQYRTHQNYSKWRK